MQIGIFKPSSVQYAESAGESGAVNRGETLYLLNELLVIFESIQEAPMVSLANVGGGSSDWELQIRWLAADIEKKILGNFALKHGLTIRESKEYTFFR